MMPVKIFEAFSGIGTTRMGLNDAGIPYISKGISDIDKYTVRSYNAIHGPTENFGDINLVEEFPRDLDLLTASFCCQDLSMAGLRNGMDKDSGTRSALGWRIPEILEGMQQYKRPKFILEENVPAITYRSNIKNLNRMISRFSDLGYQTRYAILNAKNFDIPQNRERWFMVCRLGGSVPEFPKGSALSKCLGDMLEQKVDEKYWLSQRSIDGLTAHKERQKAKGHGFGFEPVRPGEIAHSLTTGEGYHSNSTYVIFDSKFDADCVVSVEGCSDPICVKHTQKILIKNCTEMGYTEAHPGDGIILDQPNSKTKRGRVQQQCAPTVMTSGQIGVVIKGINYNKSTDWIRPCDVQDNISPTITTTGKIGVIVTEEGSCSIRRLTPKECWRLMGVNDSDFDKVRPIMSDCQLYKQAGNAIVVPVLSEIYKSIFGCRPSSYGQSVLDRFTIGSEIQEAAL